MRLPWHSHCPSQQLGLLQKLLKELFIVAFSNGMYRYKKARISGHDDLVRVLGAMLILIGQCAIESIAQLL
ncbi:hypothetical protein [Methylophilus sp. VKM B-3414]|uniref:hypothetical protein n=1 Tax=Methylophilus sp. VKM B-3414 TaxID=3076121 RepID=UPI0028D77D84|nr:hypothetical protein [Methylophilus sp. VKM B-3414]